jgi:hypothetical protein
MKTKTLFPALLVIVGLAGTSALAEDIVKPTVAPAVSAGSDRNAVEEPAIIDHVVYLARLPTPDELVRGAELKATPIVRMDQTTDRIVVVYQYAGGRTVTFAYTLLSTAGSSRAPVAVSSNANYTVVAPPPPPPVTTTVVYAEPGTVYYAPSVRYYDPAWDFWTPLAVGIGLGWGFGGHYGYGHGYSHGYGGGGWHGGHGGHR